MIGTPYHPDDLDVLVRQRQERLDAARATRVGTGSLRVRIGRVLIAMGTAVGGERLQHAARRPAKPAHRVSVHQAHSAH